MGVALACGAVRLTGAELGFDTAVIESTTGLKGARIEAEGVFKVSSPRKDLPVSIDGWKTGSDDNAVALTAEELQGVLKSLCGDGINIVAIHSHMTEETPRIIFLRYWGRGKATALATSVKKALATQKK